MCVPLVNRFLSKMKILVNKVLVKTGQGVVKDFMWKMDTLSKMDTCVGQGDRH